MWTQSCLAVYSARFPMTYFFFMGSNAGQVMELVEGTEDSLNCLLESMYFSDNTQESSSLNHVVAGSHDKLGEDISLT